MQSNELNELYKLCAFQFLQVTIAPRTSPESSLNSATSTIQSKIILSEMDPNNTDSHSVILVSNNVSDNE